MTVTPAEAKRQALVIYVFANIGLVFSLALPAAGMINHLLGGIASFERAAALWLLLSLALHPDHAANLAFDPT